MNNNDKIPEGPLDVAGEYTPISKQKIQQIETHRWGTMTVDELYDQRSILHSRYIMAAQCGNASIMNQIQVGIDQLSAIINSKASDDIELI